MDSIVKRLSTLFGKRTERRNTLTTETTPSNVKNQETVIIQGIYWNWICECVNVVRTKVDPG